jgi:hypothetical protein
MNMNKEQEKLSDLVAALVNNAAIVESLIENGDIQIDFDDGGYEMVEDDVEIYCGQCEQELKGWENFCPTCGIALEDDGEDEENTSAVKYVDKGFLFGQTNNTYIPYKGLGEE